MAKVSKKRTRNWTCIVYPDSVPNNWRDVLDSTHVKWVESPLHDKDTNPDGTIKKAHWHLLLAFDGVKTYQQVSAITKSVNGTIPQPVASSVGLVRYMIHMDNPEKYQYDKSKIIGHCGADVDGYFKLTTTSRLQSLQEIAMFIISKHITNFAELTKYCIQNNEEWFEIIADHNTLFINKLLDAEWQLARTGGTSLDDGTKLNRK